MGFHNVPNYIPDKEGPQGQVLPGVGYFGTKASPAAPVVETGKPKTSPEEAWRNRTDLPPPPMLK